ncbi:MAG TPA: hypothetical protein VIM07_00195 [Chitinophagaceae bacterium]
MKVYYRLKEDQQLKGGANDYEKGVGEVFSNIADATQQLIFEKFKYKIMWDLRSIENEINEEGGIIIITTKGVETKNFTQYLSDKIIDLLRNAPQ